MKQIKIVADSSANLNDSASANFASVPLKILAGEKEYVDTGELDVSAMLRELREWNGPSGTACPGPGEWLASFGDATYVFGVALTSKISGAYNAAQIAAKEYTERYPNRRVYILDSLTTGPELELIVEKYRELVGSGLSFDDVCAGIRRYASRTHLIFSLESLLNFARNGRVNPALAKIAGLLGIRIVGRASKSGELEPLHKSRGEAAAIQTLMKCLAAEGFTGGKVRIRHSDNLQAAQSLAERIRAAYPECDLFIGENRGLCSYYAEKGGLLVGFEGGEA